MVTVNGVTSDLVTVPCDTPQGSVLGHILENLINIEKSSFVIFHSEKDN